MNLHQLGTGRDECWSTLVPLIVLPTLLGACDPGGRAIDPRDVAAPVPILGSARDFRVDEIAPNQPEACGTGHRAWLDGIAGAPALVVIRAAKGCSVTESRQQLFLAAAETLGALARTIVLLDVSDAISASAAAEMIASAGRAVDGWGRTRS
ncbi:hypothetical protein ACIA2T_35110 [Amycolatopsis japonica]|uniref:hypothetical protein n=1 Tax=Amycolatopsis japonica TaxID=208439 RepID=UPI0037AE3A00